MAGGADAAAVVGVSPDAAWAFTRVFSPRAAVWRYAGDAPSAPVTVHGPVPAGPWAIHLTDSDHFYRRLAFDFDAKDPGDEAEHARRRAAAAHDADTLAGMLDELGIAHVVCASGPGGGRHVWVALSDRLPVTEVAALARLTRTVLPTLDISPLTNRVTGLVRPPGAPHKHGGHSRVIAGDLDQLIPASTSRADIDALTARLTAIAPPPKSLPEGVSARRLPIDVDPAGEPWIPGSRRSLSAHGHALAHSPIEDAGADASARLFALLCSAARAHWTIADVARDLAHSPGLEHVRTVRTEHAGRRPRPAEGANCPARVLLRNWRRAVDFLADNSTTTDPNTVLPEDLDFAHRAGIHAAAIAHMQQRADACFGRWARPGGAKDRRVLDALCRISLDVLEPVVGAAIRTLATMTGISRDSANRSLHALADDGWIELASETSGIHAALWRLLPYGHDNDSASDTSLNGAASSENPPPPPIHTEPNSRASLGATAPTSPEPHPAPPTETGDEHRRRLLRHLTTSLELGRHDAFTSRREGGLGSWAGLIYSRTPEIPTEIETAFPVSTPPETLLTALDALYNAGLIALDDRGRIARTDPSARDSYADHAGTTGTLTARAEQYAIEQELWAWWVDEAMWTTARGRHHRTTHYRSARRRPNQHALPLDALPTWANRPAYPRRSGGRRDHHAARKVLVRDL